MFCIYVYVPHFAWSCWEFAEVVRSPGAGDTEGCESQLGCWERNPDSLKEQVCLVAETFLWPLILDVLYLTCFTYFQLVPFEPAKLSF